MIKHYFCIFLFSIVYWCKKKIEKKVHFYTLWSCAKAAARKNKKNEKRVALKLKNGEKINFVFMIHSYSQINTHKPLLDLLLKDDRFNVSYCFYPFITDFQPKEICEEKMKKATECFKTDFPDIQLVPVHCNEQGVYDDVFQYADIAYFSLPYDHTTEIPFKQEHFFNHGVLTIHTNYSFFVTAYMSHLKELIFFPRLWFYFADNKENTRDYFKCFCKKAVETGFLRMDAWKEYENKPKETSQTVILLSPHYMTDAFANFYAFADVYKELPKRYPDVLFIWRPHPLLKTRVSEKWGAEKTEKYFEEILSNENVRGDVNSDKYLKTFFEADALIHDCGSFLAEWLFTEKPALYISKPEKELKPHLTKTGMDCWKHHYHAFTDQDVFDFIDNVIAGRDEMKAKRVRFARKVLKKNYPHAAEKIVQTIVNRLEKVAGKMPDETI